MATARDDASDAEGADDTRESTPDAPDAAEPAGADTDRDDSDTSDAAPDVSDAEHHHDAADHDAEEDQAADEADTEGDGTAAAPAKPPRRRRTAPARLVAALVALAVVTGVVAVGVLVWTFTTRSWEVLGFEVAGDTASQQSERDELMSVGRQFMLRSGTYGPDGLDEENRLGDYRDSVGELITPSFNNTFDTDAGIAEQLVAQAQVSRSAEVFGTGVSEMDDDRAVVLVAGAITDTYPQQEQAQEPFPFRVEVQLVKVDGEWLVDDFAGVQRPDAGQPQPGVDPDLPIPEEDDGSGQGGSPGGDGQGGTGQDGAGQGGQGSDR